MKLAVFPKYEDLFPGRPAPDLKDVLARTSSVRLLKAFSFMNFKSHLWSDNLSEQERMFQKWIDVFDGTTRLAIQTNYLAFKRKIIAEDHAVTLFAPSALLRLVEQVLLNFNTLPEETGNRIDDEMVLLEAWLINNSTFDLEVAENTKPEVDNLLGVLLVNGATQYEFSERKDFIYQTLLAHAFFQFLANDADLRVYLNEFLEKKQVATPSGYLRHLIGVYTLSYREDSFGFGVAEENVEATTFFDSMAHDLTTNPFANLPQRTDPDYKLLRSKPLIKEKDGTYYSLHHNFFIDKIYQGLLFDFYWTTNIKERYRNFGSFLQYLGQDFAEQHIFYDYVVGCFRPKSYLVTVPGDRYKDIEYSDYYVREGNTLYLFEFKNSIVNAQVKQSKDFGQIKAEILKKLVYNPANKQDKGISQLLKVIDKVSSGGFSFDDLALKRIGRLTIYPIIVCTDDFFTLDGLQPILSEEFQNLLKDGPPNRHRINDITLMHLRDVIDIQFMVGSGKTTFKEIIETYFKKKKSMASKKPRSPQELLDKYSGFRPLVQSVVRSYSDQEALFRRLSLALNFEESL